MRIVRVDLTIFNIKICDRFSLFLYRAESSRSRERLIDKCSIRTKDTIIYVYRYSRTKTSIPGPKYTRAYTAPVHYSNEYRN